MSPVCGTGVPPVCCLLAAPESKKQAGFDLIKERVLRRQRQNSNLPLYTIVCRVESNELFQSRARATLRFFHCNRLVEARREWHVLKKSGAAQIGFPDWDWDQ